MKAYIFKDAYVEYDSCSEDIRSVYLVDDSTPDMDKLEIEWALIIKEERQKVKASGKRWTKGYLRNNGLSFESWIEKKYNGKQISFSEHIDE